MSEAEVSMEEEEEVCAVGAPLRLLRYLYLGTETNKYFPGDWRARGCFTIDQLTALPEMVTDVDGASNFLEQLTFVKEHGMRGGMEVVLFALAAGVKHAQQLQPPQPSIVHRLYQGALPLLEQGEDLLTFCSYLKLLNTGTGSGWRKMVKAWYRGRPPLQLAQEVSRVKSRWGCCHSNLARLLHLKVEEANIELNVVMQYLVRGLESAQQLFGEKEEAKQVLAVLADAEQLRRCDEPAEAAGMLGSKPQLCLQHLHPSLLNNHLVWEMLLESMSVEQVLGAVMRLQLGELLLDEDTPCPPPVLLLRSMEDFSRRGLVSPLVARLSRAERAPPLLVYTVMCMYLINERPLKKAKKEALENNKRTKLAIIAQTLNPNKKNKKCATRNWQQQKRKGVVLGHNPRIDAALESLLSRSLAPLPCKVPCRLLITLDMRPHMYFGHIMTLRKRMLEAVQEDGEKPAIDVISPEPLIIEDVSHKHQAAACFYNYSIKPADAAVLLALSLCSHVSDVTVCVFSGNTLVPVSLWKEDNTLMTMQEAHTVLKEHAGSACLAAPMLWAQQQRKEVDVFVNVVDRLTRIMEFPKGAERDAASHTQQALQAYQTEMGLAHAGLASLSLAGFRGSSGSAPRILDLVGFDEHVMDVILTFATHARDKL